jgi:hypothetical protein
VNPPLLGMRKVVSEDSMRRNLEKIGDEPGRTWLQNHLDYCTTPLLGEPWILDMEYGEALVWPPGRSESGVQPAQTRPSLA